MAGIGTSPGSHRVLLANVREQATALWGLVGKNGKYFMRIT